MTRRALRIVSAATLALALALSAAAGAGTTSPGTPAAGYRLLAHADGALPRLSHSRLARSSVNWTGGPTTTATGETVTVYVSATLPPELGTQLTWASFIAGLPHGPEISSLTAYIATYAEMQTVCGKYALGCYAGDRMVAMGETVEGVSAADVVRHEYGHHIAFHRANSPWSAIDWGPKHWATAADVCRRADQGTASPGGEGDDYSRNPGEAWAETYRLLAERRAGVVGAPWEIVDESYLPDEAAFAAAERDVLRPWTSPRRRAFEHRFTKTGRKKWEIPLKTQLDGTIDVTLTLPRNGLQDASLVDSQGTVLATALWASRRTKGLSATVCGHRSVVLRVTQKGAFGRVVATASWPEPS
jgi:hypothetical protein